MVILLVARFTLLLLTPGSAFVTRSTDAEQDAQDIPPIIYTSSLNLFLQTGWNSIPNRSLKVHLFYSIFHLDQLAPNWTLYLILPFSSTYFSSEYGLEASACPIKLSDTLPS